MISPGFPCIRLAQSGPVSRSGKQVPARGVHHAGPV